MERLLQERCVRNQLDERMLPRLLDAHPAARRCRFYVTCDHGQTGSRSSAALGNAACSHAFTVSPHEFRVLCHYFGAEEVQHRGQIRSQDLVKLRRQAQLPPEALEPLSAFRGDVRWSFDSRERLQQKLEGQFLRSCSGSVILWTFFIWHTGHNGMVLEVRGPGELALMAVAGVQGAIEALKKSPDVAELLEALPEKQTRAHPSGLHHPWRNHLGFESFVPRGVAGGTKFGQPEEQLATELQQLRYPTLQRVAHTLPKDLKWRAHVVRSIRVLERNRHWAPGQSDGCVLRPRTSNPSWMRSTATWRSLRAFTVIHHKQKRFV